MVELYIKYCGSPSAYIIYTPNGCGPLSHVVAVTPLTARDKNKEIYSLW